jgi:hypothetical protein
MSTDMADTSLSNETKTIHLTGDPLRHPLTVTLIPKVSRYQLQYKIKPALRDGLHIRDIYITDETGSTIRVQNISDGQQLLVKEHTEAVCNSLQL